LQDSRSVDAQTAYDSARELFIHGNLLGSQQLATSWSERLRNRSPDWATRFQLLEAESLLQRGMVEDVLRLLGEIHTNAGSDALVRKFTIEGIALIRQLQLVRAEEKLGEAEQVCQRLQSESCGDSIQARGILAARQGNLNEARTLFLDTHAFAQAHDDEYLGASSDLNIGWLSLQTDRDEEALDWLKKAFQISAGLGAEDIHEKSSGNMGWAYFELGDSERASDLFREAKNSASRRGNIRSELGWESTIGYVYRDSGDWKRAEVSYREALDLARQLNSREDIENCLEDLADLSVDTGEMGDADAYIRQLTTLEGPDSRQPSSSLLLVKGKLAANRNQFAQAETDLRAVQSDSASLLTTRLNAGYEMALIFETQNDTKAAEREYQLTLAAYEAARSQLRSEESQLPFGTNAAQIYDHYIHLLVQEGKSAEALAVADQSRAQTLEQSFEASATKRTAQFTSLNPQAIAQKTGSTLLFYWLGEKQSYLWAITRAKTAMFTLPPRRDIDDRIARYQKTLLDVRDPLEAGNPDGQALYRDLVGPGAAMIRPGDSVIVFADGVLSELNFETLLAPGPPRGNPQNANPSSGMHYLLDDFTFSSAPSLSMLAATAPNNGASQRILLLGNPIAPDQDFPSLPMFGWEMTRIESHFDPAQVSALAGQQATPAAYAKSDPRSYAYIHFVSHAVASQTNPLDSAIILSNAPGQEDSYKLYAREIIQHPIDAKLVTISACYGSGTRAYAGEGLVGLSWAFLRAGAQRVIGALWEVSDESTPRLMDSLYQGLTTGDSPAVALRNAKLAMLHSQSRFSVPYYWAPFQMYARR
jgi:CHAT domain-containing protein